METDGVRRPFRIIVSVAAFSIAWPSVTGDFNLYLNQEHLLDRVVVIALLGLLWWRPAFVFPFLLCILPLIAQRDEPLQSYYWTAHVLPLRVLILFASMFVLGAAARRWRVTSFFFLVLCFVGSHYAGPGITKLRANWLFTEHAHLFVPVRFAIGWREFLNEKTLGVCRAYLI